MDYSTHTCGISQVPHSCAYPDGELPEVSVENHTSYCTEDLVEIIEQTIRTVHEATGDKMTKPFTIHVRYIATADDYDSEDPVRLTAKLMSRSRYRWRQHGFNMASPNTLAREVTLFMPRPSWLSDSALAAISMNLEKKAPISLSIGFSEAFLKATQLRIREGVRPTPDVETLPNIRVVRRKSNRPKLTQEDRIRRCLNHYGTGKALEGSSKTWHGLWSYRIGAARRYYDREYFRREKWREKAEKLGYVFQESETHRTFAEYLRELADRIDKENPWWSQT